MTINFEAEVKSLNGKTIMLDLETVGTLGKLCVEALLSPSEKNVSGKEKFERWELARKLHGEVDLKAEEVTKIKELAGDRYAAGVVGPIYDLLENKKV